MPDQSAGNEAEPDQSEERQREVQNLRETGFDPAEKKQEGESGGRSEKWRDTGKT
jgi:hypothetical protein